jgi:hypothetical protein
MKLVSIEPTPNPNSMKINLDESLAAGIKYTFTQQDQRNYPAYAKKILAIPGVVSLFQVNDFMSIHRQPNADWESILVHVRKELEVEKLPMTSAHGEQERLNEHFGEVRVFLQMFRRLPMLVKVSNLNNEKRLALDPRFQEAVSQASKASKNMLMERQWKAMEFRYGTLEQVGKAVVEEIDAAYDDKRLSILVDGAFNYDPDQKEKKRLNDQELDEHVHSDDWRKRFAALLQIGADPEQFNLFVKMAQDQKMNIRRLAIIYLGLIKEGKVLTPLCEALKDESVAVRRTAGDALTDLGDVHAIGPVTETLKDANKLVRWRAARFLYEHGDQSALKALILTANDPEFEVRMQVRQAIERIESGSQAQGNVWQQMTRQSDKKNC